MLQKADAKSKVLGLLIRLKMIIQLLSDNRMDQRKTLIEEEFSNKATPSELMELLKLLDLEINQADQLDMKFFEHQVEILQNLVNLYRDQHDYYDCFTKANKLFKTISRRIRE